MPVDDLPKIKGSKLLGIVSVAWDEAAQLATINYTNKPSVTFSATQIPGNVAKTVPAYQAWVDANVQQFLEAKGFEAFIKIKIRTVNATTGFVTLEYLVFGTQEDRDAYVFPDSSLGPGPSQRVRASSR
jgi:hypothetical protein